MRHTSYDDKIIPATMSTQHPDNARTPEWCKDCVIDGDAEIYEAYFAYRFLGCHEVMWDSEGKDVDTRVVRKLLDKHWDYFSEHQIGKDVFLTYRIPNPKIEAVERKVVVETLQNIPVAYDVASSLYKNEITPIFEVILPFTTDSREPIWLYNYYKKVVVETEEMMLNGSSRVKDWVGSFEPKAIQVIPLIEDCDSILAIDRILEPYITAVKPKYLRVFVARSDPALNYGLLCAVLLSKLALSKLKFLEKRRNVKIYPILGVGSMPFRGHLSPENMEDFLRENKGLATVTVQSALKYDYPLEQVRECVNILNNRLPNGEPTLIESPDEEKLIAVLKKSRRRYESVVEELAPLINSIASYVPQRRARKLHIGLFGYSRNVAGVVLPRAIPFAAALYSLGIPPELIGGKIFVELEEDKWEFIQKHYINLKNDLDTAGGYLSWQNIDVLMNMHSKVAERAGMSKDKLKAALTKILEDLTAIEGNLGVKLGPRSLSQKRHENFVNNFLISYLEHEDNEAVASFLEAAKLRKCLG